MKKTPVYKWVTRFSEGKGRREIRTASNEQN
jgi:hypothetical protein